MIRHDHKLVQRVEAEPGFAMVESLHYRFGDSWVFQPERAKSGAVEFFIG